MALFLDVIIRRDVMESFVDYTQEEKGDILVLRVVGRLDATSSPMLEKKIVALIDGGKTKLVVNFNGVEYLSSAGMRLLLSMTKKINSKNGKIVISGVSSDVLDVIKMAGFDRILQITRNEEEALKVFV